MDETTPRLPTLRRSDFSLSDTQHELKNSFAQFFQKECPTTVVREAEPMAFDAALWRKVRDLGVLTMGLPEALDGDGAGLVELALVLEEHGCRIAPIPLIENVVVLRTLAALEAEPALADLRDGEVIATLAPLPQRTGAPQLVPNAAIAGAVLGLLEGELVLARPDAPAPLAKTLGGAPLGWCDLAAHRETTVLATGGHAREAFDRARLEWKVLTAAALVGLARGALEITVKYANDRIAFGVPIGTFQALSHPLADVRIAIEGGRRLVWRAAWFLDNEPDRAAVHVAMAYFHACETANRAPSQGIHTQGGFGFTLESDLPLHFRRAKSWSLVNGDPRSELAAIADLLFEPSISPRSTADHGLQ